MILASGGAVNLSGVAISGGTLKSTAGGLITAHSNGDVVRSVTIAASSLIEVVSQGTLTLNGGTLGTGAIIETLTGGTAIMSGAVTNGGTLFASASGSLVEIASGAVVNGGVALIGDGIINIAGSSGGHGRLYIASARPVSIRVLAVCARHNDSAGFLAGNRRHQPSLTSQS